MAELPSALRLGEQDKRKYLAIGESNRMTLPRVSFLRIEGL